MKKRSQNSTVKETHPNKDNLSSQFYDVIRNDTGVGVFMEKVPHEMVYTKEGTIACAIVYNGCKYLIYNFHPFSKSWKQVYSLPHCNPWEQCSKSIDSLKRLVESV